MADPKLGRFISGEYIKQNPEVRTRIQIKDNHSMTNSEQVIRNAAGFSTGSTEKQERDLLNIIRKEFNSSEGKIAAGSQES
jgi:hypothetical protein